MTPNQVHYVRHIVEHARTDLYAKRVANGYVPVHETLNSAVLERHLDTSPAIGQYLLDRDRVRAAVFDLDSHDGATPWSEMVAVALNIIDIAKKLGLQVHAFRSGGGNGLHLWFLWEDAQTARHVRHLLRTILASFGFKDGTGGVARREIEVFPKQDAVRDGGVGSLIAVPGARASEPLSHDLLEPVDWELIDVTAETLRFSGNVPAVVEGDRAVSTASKLPGDISEASSALSRIPADEYTTWLRVALAMKAVFGDDGYEAFLTWSATAPDKFDGEEKLRRFWDGLKPNGEVGLGTIFHLARERGWNGPSNSMVREMNARFGIYTHGNATLIIVKNGDRRPEDDFPTLSKPVFIDRLAAETIVEESDSGATLRHSKAKRWLAHPLAAHYHRLDFDPALSVGHNRNTWNTWLGFGVEPVHGDWSLLQRHIEHVICRGDENLAAWFFNWMALGVQRPGEVIGTAPVLIGMPGTGKGFVAHAYGKLWGAHYVTVTHPEHVVGRFSGHLMSKRFVFIDEGTFGGNRQVAGQLKVRITEPVLMFERKGIDPIKMKNRMIFMVASNELSAVPADINDRRWQVFDVGDNHRGDRAYFSAIADQLENGGHEAMLYDLLKRDISIGPDPRKTIKTEALFEQIVQSQGPDFAYLHMILENGRLPQNWLEGPAITTIRAMMEELRRSIPNARFLNEIGLGRRLNKVFPNISTQVHGRYFIRMSDNGPIVERSKRYIFPPLPEARRQFERFAGVPVPWDTSVDEWQNDPEPDGEDDGSGAGIIY